MSIFVLVANADDEQDIMDERDERPLKAKECVRGGGREKGRWRLLY